MYVGFNEPIHDMGYIVFTIHNTSASIFKITFFGGYIGLGTIFKILKINNFRVDLTDIVAETKPLHNMFFLVYLTAL